MKVFGILVVNVKIERKFKTLSFILYIRKNINPSVKVEAQKCVNIPTQTCENVPVVANVPVPQKQCYRKPR